ncbi:phosphopentomutase isoform X2 [Plodia interpunctella]|uniref:phosphopentomutase isoform X2 n=1 Tax=Plodia interpunctella TaxID=58824 RepID=UPI0023676E70|nr:phosphopentomutase isoform X2 [Plodia interpunctella]
MSLCKSGDTKLDDTVNGWLKRDKNVETRQEVEDDIANARWDKLRKVMLHRQRFGTAGLRGRMGAGYVCMNDVVILQTAQGLCSYLKDECSQSKLQGGVVVGYDGRYNSKRFAELTAKVFTSSSIPVHLFSTVCPTPLVSFATIRYGACAGVMVTASHNPKEDNGYKVYWGNGSQIITPHDDNILEEILRCLDIPDEHWNIDEIRTDPLVSDCTEEITTKYMEYIRGSLSESILEQNKMAAVDIVYSAMHGVGYKYIVKAFEVANLKPPISVVEQQEPEPSFPTVAEPNPERPASAQLALARARAAGARLALLNDPDADRLAVAEYDPTYSQWKIFTGNEMGALLGWWILEQHCSPSSPPSDAEVYVLASVVSSKMLQAIVKGRGQFVETLTGFKWMGNTCLLLQQQGARPLFAFEEAIGYMCDPAVPDKDGVSAAVQVASLASKLYSSGSSLQSKLYELYRQYGYHVSYNSYYICHDPNTIHNIFQNIRNWKGELGKYPTKLGACEITSINDFSAGVRIPDEAPGESHLNVVGTGLDKDYNHGEMIMFRCSNGLRVTVRTSGTEPKLKYYTELVCKADTRDEQEMIKNKLEVMVQEFVTELLRPKENGLIG